MRKEKLINETAKKYVDETLKLIIEKGGLLDVNLREISKRVGCAHTNAYNYFDGFEGLVWATYEEALDIYKDAIVNGLHSELSGKEYFCKLMNNIISFAIENTGIYRFISSDPLNIENMSDEIVGKIITMKQYYYDVFYELAKTSLNKEESDHAADILLSYLDGETFNMINYRYLPEENIMGRIMKNLELLFKLLTSKKSDGIDINSKSMIEDSLNFPKI